MMSSESQSTADRQPKWCERCKCFHPWTPPWEVTEKQIISDMVQAIADEIDREVMEQILREAK